MIRLYFKDPGIKFLSLLKPSLLMLLSLLPQPPDETGEIDGLYRFLQQMCGQKTWRTTSRC